MCLCEDKYIVRLSRQFTQRFQGVRTQPQRVNEYRGTQSIAHATKCMLRSISHVGVDFYAFTKARVVGISLLYTSLRASKGE